MLENNLRMLYIDDDIIIAADIVPETFRNILVYNFLFMKGRW